MGNKRTRRIRRQTKQVLKHGVKAKRAHKKKSGRTGQIRHKQLKAVQLELRKNK
jgi:hypothetical protein